MKDLKIKKYEKPLDIIIHKIDYSEGGKESDVYWMNQGLGNAHTHGMGQYGFIDICLGIDLEERRTYFILNTICELICDPNEEFDFSVKHIVYDKNDEIQFEFHLMPAFCYDEPSFLVILADEDGHYPTDLICKEPYNLQYVDHCDIEIIHKNYMYSCNNWLQGEEYD